MQLFQRGVTEAASLTGEERRAQGEEFASYMMECRRKCEAEEIEEIAETENLLEGFMADRFRQYVPLDHHLMGYQMRNVLAEYSKETPAALKSKYNLYLGGEGQGRESMSNVGERVSSRAREEEGQEGEAVGGKKM